MTASPVPLDCCGARGACQQSPTLRSSIYRLPEIPGNGKGYWVWGMSLLSCHWPKAKNAGGLGAEPSLFYTSHAAGLNRVVQDSALTMHPLCDGPKARPKRPCAGSLSLCSLQRDRDRACPVLGRRQHTRRWRPKAVNSRPKAGILIYREVHEDRPHPEDV